MLVLQSPADPFGPLLDVTGGTHEIWSCDLEERIGSPCKPMNLARDMPAGRPGWLMSILTCSSKMEVNGGERLEEKAELRRKDLKRYC